MPEPLPAEIVVTETPDGVHYHLPRPQLGSLRVAGAFLVPVGLVPLGMGAAFITFAVKDFLLQAPFPINLFVLLILVVPLLFVVAGLALMFFGGVLLVGTGELRLTPSSLVSTLRLGPLRWSRRRARGQLRIFAVIFPRQAGANPGGAQWCSLKAEGEGFKPLTVAIGYPPDWLRALADDLARRCRPEGSEALEAAVAPVRVVERTEDLAGDRQSRAWQARTKSGCGRLLGCLFFIPFLFVGCLFFVLILGALLKGDPDNHLDGQPGWKWWWILFPLPFIAIGGGGLIYQLVHWRKGAQSPEREKAARPGKHDGAAARSGRGKERASADQQTDLPTVPMVSPGPGVKLRYRLSMKDTPGCNALALLIGAVVCSGVLTPFVRNVVTWVANEMPHGNWPVMSGIFVLFFGLAWVMLVYHGVRQLLLSRLGKPVVELSPHPLHAGEEYQLLVTLSGPVRLKALRVAVVCVEEAKYRQGTDTRTETCLVHYEKVLAREEFTVDRDRPCKARHESRLPPEAMHSFEAANNQVKWLVRVEGEVVRWPDFKYEFPFAVHPPPQPGAKP